MTLVCVLVTVAFLALVLQFPGGGVPRHVLVKVHAVLAVIASERKKEIKIVFILKLNILFSLCVVITLASSVHHAGDVFQLLLLWDTPKNG